MNTETPYTLCSEMLRTLRSNLLLQTLTTRDDAEFERLLGSWGDRLANMTFGYSRERIDAAVVELWTACKCASVPDSATLTADDLALFEAAARHPAVQDRSPVEPHPLFVHEPAEDASALRWEQNHIAKEGVAQ